jgi:hypothetical protein
VTDRKRLKLKGIIRVSFVRSEKTNLDLYKQSSGYPGDLGSNEAFLFISKKGDQVIFIFQDADVSVKKEDDSRRGTGFRRVLDSRRLRLGDGVWHPYMLQEYAHAVGLHLIGIPTLTQVLRKKREGET